MRVLVTGANGFLGRYVCEELRKQGIRYSKWERSIDGDLRDERVVLGNGPIFSEFSTYTHIIHLAAKCGGIQANLNSPYEFIHDNLLMGLNVIDLALSLEAKLVFVSTICAYPEIPKTIPFIEDELFDGMPESSNLPYGIAKRTLMTALQAAKAQHGLHSVTLNLANMYGNNADSDLETSHVIPAIIAKIQRAKETGEKVILWGDGTPTRDFLHAKCASRAIFKALFCEYFCPHGMNIGTGIEKSIRDITEILCKYMDFPLSNVVWNGSEINGQKRRVLNCSLAKMVLNWQSEISIEDGLQELVLHCERIGDAVP